MGGAEQVALSIASSPTPDFEYHIVEVMRGHSAYTETFTNEMCNRSIYFHRSPVPLLFKFHFVFERLAALLFPLWFVWIFRKYRPEVLHTHTEVPDMAVMWFMKLFRRLTHGVLLVRTIHNTRLWTGQKAMARRFECFAFTHGFNVAISHAVAEMYEKQYKFPTLMINNGVELPRQEQWPHLAGGRLNVLFAGRMEPQKGISSLMRIVSSLEDDERYHFHIVGDGSMRRELEQMLGDQQNVSFYPPVYGINRYLSSFDLLLMPSEFEGLSIMAIEASMAALPVVCNSCNGLIDTLPPAWPFSVKDNSLAQYMRLFRKVIPFTNLTAIGTTAQEFARLHFGIRRMQILYEKVYTMHRS